MELYAVYYFLQNYTKPQWLHMIISYISNAIKREVGRARVGKTPAHVKMCC